MRGATVSSAVELANLVSKETEASILKQLNWLVSRGLLVAEMGPLLMTQEAGDECLIKVSQTCNLVLNNKEYVEKLEKENKEMKAAMDALHSDIKAIFDRVKDGV